MNVQQLIDELMKVNDKTKSVVTLWNAGTDFDKEPFLEEGKIRRVIESNYIIELLDDMKPKY